MTDTDADSDSNTNINTDLSRLNDTSNHVHCWLQQFSVQFNFTDQ